MNLGERLCDMAEPGTILASQRTIAASQINAVLLPEPLTLKGYSAASPRLQPFIPFSEPDVLM